MLRKTKIVCTIGPASNSEETLKALINAGMNVARLNFSHGDHQTHKENIDRIRKVSAELSKPVAILQDLCGPKIRLCEIENDSALLNAGDTFFLYGDKRLGNSSGASINYPDIDKELSSGDKIMIDDGLLELRVEKIEDREILCRVINSGKISSRKGVNFPGVRLSVNSLTEKDLNDLKFGIENRVDFVAVSFVRQASDLQPAIDLMIREGVQIPIISKIEKAEAVDDIENILDKSYGIMIARGDLGVEMPFEQVPIVQKQLIKLARQYSKPVITATQMMDSMIRNPYPTRAEANDVANAIIDGTDAIMLSGETASGAYPVKSVEAMVKISLSTEQALPYDSVLTLVPTKSNAVEMLSLAACEMAYTMKAQALLIFTTSGRSAVSVSNFRPDQIILAATQHEETLRKLLLSWAVYPFIINTPSGHFTHQLEEATDKAIKSGYLRSGDGVIITAGLPDGMVTSTNTVMFHIVKKSVIRGHGAGIKQSVTAKVRIINNEEELETKFITGEIIVLQDCSLLSSAIAKAPAGVICTKPILAKPAEVACPIVHDAVSASQLIEDQSIITIDSSRGIITYTGKEL